MGNPTSMSAGRAIVWQFLSKASSVVIQFVLTAILARLLTPAEYGTVAIVTVFVAFFSMLADVGISPAIIQFDDLSEQDISSLFTFTILLGIVLALGFAAVAPLISAFYNVPQLTSLCRLASLSILFASADMVPNGILLKNKRFRSIGIRLVATTLVAGAIAVFLAMQGWGCYALVCQIVVQSALVLIWNLADSRIRPRIHGMLAPLKRVFRYSAFQALFSFVNYFARNLDNLLVGRFLGSEALGQYDKAYMLNTYPVSYMSIVVGSVIQPYLAPIKDDFDAIYDWYTAIAKPVTLVGAWMSTVFTLCSSELVVLLFGEQWALAGNVLQLLSLSLAFQMLGSLAGPMFQSVGRTDLMFASSVVNTVITMTGIVVGVLSNNLIILAAGVAAAYVLHSVTNTLLLVGRSLKKSPLRFARLFLPEVILVCAAGWLGFHIPGSDLPALTLLLLKGATASATCAGFFMLTGQLPYIRQAMSRLIH